MRHHIRFSTSSTFTSSEENNEKIEAIATTTLAESSDIKNDTARAVIIGPNEKEKNNNVKFTIQAVIIKFAPQKQTNRATKQAIMNYAPLNQTNKTTKQQTIVKYSPLSNTLCV
jgi:hypothetical protein